MPLIFFFLLCDAFYNIILFITSEYLLAFIAVTMKLSNFPNTFCSLHYVGMILQ